MKKQLFSLCAIAMVALATVFIFTTCKKENCNACGAHGPHATEQVTINLTGESLETKFDILKLVIEGNKRESYYSPQPSERLFQYIKEYCKLPFNVAK